MQHGATYEPTTPRPAAPPAPPRPGVEVLGHSAGNLSPRFAEAIRDDARGDALLRCLSRCWNNPRQPSANELADALLYVCNRFKLFRDAHSSAANPRA
jgi:hypothetical protein